jgi:hypothetical protein
VFWKIFYSKAERCKIAALIMWSHGPNQCKTVHAMVSASRMHKGMHQETGSATSAFMNLRYLRVQMSSSPHLMWGMYQGTHHYALQERTWKMGWSASRAACGMLAWPSQQTNGNNTD